MPAWFKTHALCKISLLNYANFVLELSAESLIFARVKDAKLICAHSHPYTLTKSYLNNS